MMHAQYRPTRRPVPPLRAGGDLGTPCTGGAPRMAAVAPSGNSFPFSRWMSARPPPPLPHAPSSPTAACAILPALTLPCHGRDGHADLPPSR
ncbi:hypothetical protein SCP_1103740 [Sparassis crispa]|uniref:Uncharacterized protein n=1 Tax=Sparassis crispa TaxID=139825 RepID=A0A401GZV2_9APHY|nr:hypothetical protein SCP_1103740 [Sparassis crispa]GBE87697.1 hypothetical protein SCP_1103740 [Sparassis crispa]